MGFSGLPLAKDDNMYWEGEARSNFDKEMKSLKKEMKTLSKDMSKMGDEIRKEVQSSVRNNVVGGYLDVQRKKIKRENEWNANLTRSDLENAQKEFNEYKKKNNEEKDKLFSPYKPVVFEDKKKEKGPIVKSRYGILSSIFSSKKENKKESLRDVEESVMKDSIMDYNYPTKEKPYYHKDEFGNKRHYNDDLKTLLKEAIDKEITGESFIEKHYRKANGLKHPNIDEEDKNGTVLFDDSVMDMEINPSLPNAVIPNLTVDIIKTLQTEIEELKFQNEFSSTQSRLKQLENSVDMLLRGTGIKEYKI